ncbi:VacJ family lipoprotein [Defluviimonas sp. D31]|uniref:MlaA family lipoprotein n=1 Tax=Defluviimonas sp. D31 TaxID=3083253 RepID=UPI00296E4F22|nr:VacJ family lipoprotein [Defluviimonas sp. D31]MDW4551300.1 VacJ family lipoprotein [Defluviimonas sp. D31]
MSNTSVDIAIRGRSLGPVLAAAWLLAACSAPPPGVEFNDPHEAQNRAVHEENLAMDRALFGGGKPGRKPFLPEPVATSLSNFASNLDMPGSAVNSVLQVRPGPALQNALRFAINTTIGVGGLLDPATAMGIHAESTDFGETLHVWGAPEGAYLVVPIAGPTTERDAIGWFADLFVDPISILVGAPEAYYIVAARVGGMVADRQLYGETIDSILYESADSYAQMRLIHLQNRRFELGIETDVIDPYEDPYGQ